MLNNKHVVLIRLSSIGDVLHCTPVARALKKAYPDCHLTWVVGEGPADVLVANPYIDELYVWPRERWERSFRAGNFREARRLWRHLAEDLGCRPFDVALDVHGLFLSGLVARATGAPRRIGLGGAREFNWLFMTEQAPKSADDVHVIQQYLSILRPLGIRAADYNMTLGLTGEAVAFADRFLATHGVGPDEVLVAINPVTTWPAKNWPPAGFAAVAAALAADCRILLTGGPRDKEITAYIAKQSGAACIDAAGGTTLLELAALLARCRVVLTGDTGPLHMAVALGVPTVSIFGPTDPRKYGPLPPGHIILQGEAGCAPCHKKACRHQDVRCLRSVTPEAAIAAVRQQLAAYSKLQPLSSEKY
ncbi:glycosyltransferase family 9 protein [Sporolituus thermophilus]|uniref:Lipopolysaccharide heptosyltransferase I/lipopolysaccharide heptosyltransferase II,TIGR02195 n=1 Tax=Sporolituus thermophilus DSM 23256 TaxID=1123285 RepID=A0A1G7N3S9_9FIRM|nr:glycosyltransferase family 9 protein [Sporolituus thermophilus]SDF68596.1 lipopolysaccharide heptosyltransferase I/lipopolysaccharide heptosyltransferase II,TIGR02195 [Sporolituus thermophilus DSM 23256]